MSAAGSSGAYYDLAGVVQMKKGFFSKSKPTEPKELPKPIASTEITISNRLKSLVSGSSRNALELAHDNKQGRYVVVKRSFEPGEILMTAQYFATVAIQSRVDICSRCLGLCKSGTRCQLCGSMFCSKSCFDFCSAGFEISFVAADMRLSVRKLNTYMNYRALL